jgi:hypothetical protein
MTTNFDFKTILIVVLSIIIFIGSIWLNSNNLGMPNLINIEQENTKIKATNDSLLKANGLLDVKINGINIKIDSTTSLLEKNKLELIKLKTKKNEIPNYVNYLSADSVASSLSKFIEKSKS